jgi:DNA-binding CsgD family transcriptional regulator
MAVGEADVVVTFQAAAMGHVAETVSAASGLTARERDVLHLLLQGEPAKQIARRLDLSILTVNGHLQSVYRKCHVRGRDELFFRLS